MVAWMLAALDSLVLMSARMVQGCEHGCVSLGRRNVQSASPPGVEAVIPCAR
jgi:hypothetical protein